MMQGRETDRDFDNPLIKVGVEVNEDPAHKNPSPPGGIACRTAGYVCAHNYRRRDLITREWNRCETC
jgi:hypothetical protein